MIIAEKQRLSEVRERVKGWQELGPYVAERQWGTVREDYSPGGDAWDYTTHDTARSKAFRWGEEGIGGISDTLQRLCFAPAFWNRKDPIIKERLFGVTNGEGNHGEDCKELYYYLDNTPSHSYMNMLYKYPQREFPYLRLLEESRRRGRHEGEFELIDTGIFDEDHYFDIFIEYAKADANDLLIRITAFNRGPGKAGLTILPHLWFRNTWSPGYDTYKPELFFDEPGVIKITHRDMDISYLFFEGDPQLLFCENETNTQRLYGYAREGTFKDGINNFIVSADASGINKANRGTRMATRYDLELLPGASATVRLRLSHAFHANPFDDHEAVFAARKAEADQFYDDIQKDIPDKETRAIQRQTFAGMLWAKQFYHYDVGQWLTGDPAYPPPPESRKYGRNREWVHLNNMDIISMPDKWEYPWYAAWDLAFHALPLAIVDPEFAKHQLLLLTKEWYMHPNGQLPAYEWSFSDVNPPVHAWAAWRVYKMDLNMNGKGDTAFLEEVFHKLLLNFTWWVNKKDANGNNIFQGGFLGMDNIGVFDRSAELPTGGYLEQTDGTSWMAMFTLNMLRISLELAKSNPVYQSLSTKFFEHFLYIAGAMANIGSNGINLWNEEDQFFYDVLHTPNNRPRQMRVRSMVGIVPIFAVEVLEEEIFDALPEFAERLKWFLENRPELASLVSRWTEPGKGERHLLSLLRGHRMKSLLRKVLDTNEFLSEFGVRTISKYHEDHPYTVAINGHELTVRYTPGESDSSLFGGNSNWRGPVWFPVNYLLIESLYRFHHYYGDEFKVEHPTGSGQRKTLSEIADDLSNRLLAIFRRDQSGKRPVFGNYEKLQNDPHFNSYILFYEYFHGDSGKGLGASHQTGWTGLAAKLIQPYGLPDKTQKQPEAASAIVNGQPKATG